jgi:transposase
MKRIDGRKLSKSALEERRNIIIRMKENGASEKQITTATGCSRQVIYNLWNQWNASKTKKQKKDVLKVKPRGTKLGERRTLTPAQEAKIQSIILNKYPDQLGFDFALWTREAVRKLIEKEFDIVMPIRTVGEYLKRWGYTPQKPVKYAYERNEGQVKEWLQKTYKNIKRWAKRIGAAIFWGDETTIRAEDVRGRGYAPRGKTPVVKRTKRKEHIGMISAITNQGKVMWKTYEGSINSERFIEFLKQLIKYRRKRVFLIVDKARTHHSELVKQWVKENGNRIRIYYLPAYSPDLNPDEHINSDVKYGVGTKHPKRNKEELREATEEHMRLLDRSPERIKMYFLDPAISYAS